jgi:DNA polymerase
MPRYNFQGAVTFVPDRVTLPPLREAAPRCTGCDLYLHATQLTMAGERSSAQCILGPDYRSTKKRGKFVPHPWARRVTATVHPSSILRAPDQEQRRIRRLP